MKNISITDSNLISALSLLHNIHISDSLLSQTCNPITSIFISSLPGSDQSKLSKYRSPFVPNWHHLFWEFIDTVFDNAVFISMVLLCWLRVPEYAAQVKTLAISDTEFFVAASRLLSRLMVVWNFRKTTRIVYSLVNIFSTSGFQVKSGVILLCISSRRNAWSFRTCSCMSKIKSWVRCKYSTQDVHGRNTSTIYHNK